ncbi:hypothetical protein KCU66_g60, partial [Aureobasidium melanogenum]
LRFDCLEDVGALSPICVLLLANLRFQLRIHISTCSSLNFIIVISLLESFASLSVTAEPTERTISSLPATVMPALAIEYTDPFFASDHLESNLQSSSARSLVKAL